MAEYASLRKIEFELCGGNLPEKYKAFVRRVLNDRNLIPTVDAVVVTRCKDCKYMAGALPNDKGFLICPASGMEITPDDFCSYGEPKEGAE